MVKFVKFSNVAGVLAPAYQNRTDLNKYDLALEEGLNWFIDYRGGLSTRPGTEFYEWIMDDDRQVVLWPFQYSTDVANTYMILFGHNYIRFLQDGSYVLEGSKNITASSSGTYTSAAHGYSNGQWAKLASGATVVIRNVAANTFTLEDMWGAALTASLTGTTISRIYTVTSTFTGGRLPRLRFHQILDTIRITSIERDFLPFSLTRISDTNWTLAQLSFDPVVAAPTGLTGTPSGAGTYMTQVAVTAVDENGEESLPVRAFVSSMVDYTTTTGSLTLTWNAQADVKYFNVYRSIVGPNNEVSAAAQLGFIGKAFGPQFTDNNIVPDFTKSPPNILNPFANSTIKFINVTAPGSGYDLTSTVTVTDATGSGFDGVPIVYDGEVIGILVLNGGENYTAPSVTVSVGTGATFSVELGEEEGNYPAVGCVFQQRQLYASSVNRPLGIFGSRPGLYNNFGFSDIVTGNDSFDFDIDSEVIESINNLVPTRAGLLITTSIGMWQLSASNDGAVTPTDAQAPRQSYTGVAPIQPLRINEDIAILDSRYSSVRLMSYSDYQKGYISVDISVLSNHFFKETDKIRTWDFFDSPNKLIIATKTLGEAVVGCVMKEHEIFGWTNWQTQGRFLSVANLREETTDQPYFIVERFINNRVRKFVEGLTPRAFSRVEDFIGLDSALTLPITRPAARLTPSAATGVITLTANTAVFSADDVGKVFRGGGGKGVVTAYTSTTKITVDLTEDITDVVPFTTRPLWIPSGQWSLDEEFTTISGLEHLEGQTVNALVDGNVVENLTVTDGSITLPFAGSRVTVGLQYKAIAKPLPLSIDQAPVETDRKRVTGLVLWQNESRGLRVGSTLSHLYELRERANEDYGLPPGLQSGMTHSYIDPRWEETGTFYIVQDKPLPATLLGWTVDAELGDDDDRD